MEDLIFLMYYSILIIQEGIDLLKILYFWGLANKHVLLFLNNLILYIWDFPSEPESSKFSDVFLTYLILNKPINKHIP